MEFEIEHLFLVPENNWHEASHRVKRFFDHSILVKYASVNFDQHTSISVADHDFWLMLEKGLSKNKEVLTGLLDELAGEGFDSLKNLLSMDQGYQSKLLHTATHLLDGFFGIDSYFFNLAEDSHQVSSKLRNSLQTDPTGFWLVKVCGSSEIPRDDPFGHLRTLKE